MVKSVVADQTTWVWFHLRACLLWACHHQELSVLIHKMEDSRRSYFWVVRITWIITSKVSKTGPLLWFAIVKVFCWNFMNQNEISMKWHNVKKKRRMYTLLFCPALQRFVLFFLERIFVAHITLYCSIVSFSSFWIFYSYFFKFTDLFFHRI